MKKLLGKILIISMCIFLLAHLAYSANTIIVEETDLVQLELEAYDADGDELIYNFTPPLDENGEWQTDYGDEGEYNVLITVSDGKTEARDYVVIIVNHKNRAPEIEDIDDIIVTETETVTIEPVVTDYENDPMTISISFPVEDNGVWETGYDDAGEYTITITASDSINTVSKDVNIIVEELNRAPEIDSMFPGNSSVDMLEAESITFAVSASELDGDELSYEWTVDGVKLENSNRSFEFFADYDSSGYHKILVAVSDGNMTEETEWDVNIIDVNRFPVIESCSEDMTIKEGDVVEIDFTASDPDGDDLKYKVSQPVGNDKIWETTSYDAGEHEITVTVSDGEFNATESFKITVENVDVAPEFEKIDDVEVCEGDVLEIEFNATDPDGDDVVFEAKKIPEGAVLDGNKLTYAPGYDLVKHSKSSWLSNNYHQDSRDEFTAKIIAKSGNLSAEQKFKITVIDKNRAPVLGEIEEILEMNESDFIAIKPSYSDPDGDKVEIHISDPIGDDGEWMSTYEDAGEYDINIVADDGKLETVQAVRLIVNNVNREPYFENDKNLFEINEGEAVEITPLVKDPDGGMVELSAEDLPEGSSFVDGMFSWTPDFDDVVNESEKFTIKFVADDNEAAVVENFDIVVHHVNRAPVILNTSQSSLTAYVGESITFGIDAVDYDGDELSFDWHFRMFDNEQDGSALKRTFTVPGVKQITITVSDGIEQVEHIFEAKVYEKIVNPVKTPEPIVVPEPPEPEVITKTITKTVYVEKPVPQQKIMTTYIIEHDDKPVQEEQPAEEESEFTIITI